jgi:hypothetical protein
MRQVNRESCFAHLGQFSETIKWTFCFCSLIEFSKIFRVLFFGVPNRPTHNRRFGASGGASRMTVWRKFCIFAPVRALVETPACVKPLLRCARAGDSLAVTSGFFFLVPCGCQFRKKTSGYLTCHFDNSLKNLVKF